MIHASSNWTENTSSNTEQRHLFRSVLHLFVLMHPSHSVFSASLKQSGVAIVFWSAVTLLLIMEAGQTNNFHMCHLSALAVIFIIIFIIII